MRVERAKRVLKIEAVAMRSLVDKVDENFERAVERYGDLLNRKALGIMTRNPKWRERDFLAARAVRKVEEYSFTSLFVFGTGEKGIPVGIIHFRDLLKAGGV